MQLMKDTFCLRDVPVVSSAESRNLSGPAEVWPRSCLHVRNDVKLEFRKITAGFSGLMSRNLKYVAAAERSGLVLNQKAKELHNMNYGYIYSYITLSLIMEVLCLNTYAVMKHTVVTVF